MPPLRRYLRISPSSVLETRIHLDNPADLNRWLLHPTSPALPRVIEAVRPLVLPKLREERDIEGGKGGAAARARARGKGGRGKTKAGVKDVVVRGESTDTPRTRTTWSSRMKGSTKDEGANRNYVRADEFEVSIFLTKSVTRHSILRKSKYLKKEEGSTVKRRTGSQLSLTQMGRRKEDAVPVDDDDDDEDAVLIRDEQRDSDEEGNVRMADIPAAVKVEDRIDVSSDDEDDDDEEGNAQSKMTLPRQRGEERDDKKKLGFNMYYEGFAIYGYALVLVITRKTAKGKGLPGGAGQAMMEDWIGTQVQREQEGGLFVNG